MQKELEQVASPIVMQKFKENTTLGGLTSTATFECRFTPLPAKSPLMDAYYISYPITSALCPDLLLILLHNLVFIRYLVYLLNRWSVISLGSWSASSWEAPWCTSLCAGSTALSVELLHDRVGDLLQLLLHALKLLLAG